MSITSGTLNLKFMQRYAAKTKTTQPSSPAAASTPSRSPAPSPAVAAPSTPRPTPTAVALGAESHWELPGTPTPAGGAASGSGTSKGKAPVRVSYVSSYMAFMDDEDSSDEDEELKKEGGAGLGGDGDVPKLVKGRMGFGDYAPKAKSTEAPVLVTEGLSNGMKPRNAPDGSSSRLPHPQVANHLNPNSKRKDQKGHASASPLSRAPKETHMPKPVLDNKGFAKPAGFEDLPSGSGAGSSKRKNKKKRAAGGDEGDGLEDSMSAAGDILESGARASKKAKKNKKKKSGQGRGAAGEDEDDPEVLKFLDELQNELN